MSTFFAIAHMSEDPLGMLTVRNTVTSSSTWPSLSAGSPRARRSGPGLSCKLLRSIGGRALLSGQGTHPRHELTSGTTASRERLAVSAGAATLSSPSTTVMSSSLRSFPTLAACTTCLWKRSNPPSRWAGEDSAYRSLEVSE